MRHVKRLLVAAASLSVGLVVSANSAPPLGSAAAVPELVTELTSKQLDAIAAPVPDVPNRFVAALLIPGVQLLVVGAEAKAPAFLQQQIAQRQFKEAYSSLQQGAVLASKLFVQDMGADGLGSGDNVDVMYERGTKQTIFDGDWKRQHLSHEQYDDRLARADASYTAMITLLTSAARDLSKTRP